jgi:hypothetical protein
MRLQSRKKKHLWSVSLGEDAGLTSSDCWTTTVGSLPTKRCWGEDARLASSCDKPSREVTPQLTGSCGVEDATLPSLEGHPSMTGALPSIAFSWKRGGRALGSFEINPFEA